MRKPLTTRGLNVKPGLRHWV